MIRRPVVLVLLLLAALPLMAQETPSSKEVLQRALDAAGGTDAFADLALIKIDYSSRETAQDGTSHNTSLAGYASTASLSSMRLEMPGDLVIVRDGSIGWATVGGKTDPRPQTPRMAKSTTHLYLVPVLFPFSMTMDEVAITGMRSGRLGDTPAWVLQVYFGPEFFRVPVMDTFWMVYVSKEDYSVLAAGYVPQSSEKVSTEAVRYVYQKLQEVGGVRLPSQVLMEGLDPEGKPTGHNAVIKLGIEQSPWDLSLFLSPERLKALEEGDFPELE